MTLSELERGDDGTPCPFPGCVLSAAEHHRLAYGILAENRELRRRVNALDNGHVEATT